MTETVQLFVTCIIDTIYPQIGEAVVQVLERVGVQVEFPSAQTCCGQPAFNAGMREQARQMAIHTINVFENTKGTVVIPSGSCCAMIRHNYLELFSDNSEWLSRAQALAERTFEFTEYLVDIKEVVDVGANFSGKLTYHPSCHLTNGLGIKKQPQLLLDSVQNSELVELPYDEDCCGFGGVFSVEHPEISAAMLARKLDNIQKSEAPVVVSCDAGCITHINGGLHRNSLTQRAVHIAEILAKTD